MAQKRWSPPPKGETGSGVAIEAAKLDSPDHNPNIIGHQVESLPPGLNLARHRIIAAHFFGAVAVEVAS